MSEFHTIPELLKRIEELEKRVEKLENRIPVYVPPPVYGPGPGNW